MLLNDVFSITRICADTIQQLSHHMVGAVELSTWSGVDIDEQLMDLVELIADADPPRSLDRKELTPFIIVWCLDKPSRPMVINKFKQSNFSNKDIQNAILNHFIIDIKID